MSELPAADLELPEAPDPGEPFLLLESAGRTFGVALPAVLEVVLPRECSPLPGAPPEVLGLVNLRGRVVTIIDLATAMGLSEGPRPAGRVVVVAHRAGRVGLAVDDAPRILMIDPTGFTPTGGAGPSAVLAATEAEGRTLEVLDTEALIGPVLA